MSASSPMRNPNIDSVRGLAVLGIFFINILFMGNSLEGYVPTIPAAASDMPLDVFSRLFLEGRFIGLFTMLFGVGLVIQYQKLGQTGLMKRRLKVLMLFGALHGIFIWPGDVLLSYGLSAMVAIRYLDAPLAHIHKRALQFLGFSAIVMLLLTQALPTDPLPSRLSPEYQASLAPWIGSYLGQLVQHLAMMLMMTLVMLPIALLWYILGMMLLGMYLYRSQFFSEGLTDAARIRLLLLALVLGAVDLALYFSESRSLVNLAQITVIFSAIPVSVLYADLIIRLCQGRETLLKPLQNVGKLALSLYILQSLLGIACFRYLFPDWLQSFDRIHYLIAALTWAGCQLLLATWYLRYFKQGPLEKLWRYLAFGRTQRETSTQEVKS
ncbi:DUF418 domain-containing protein [Shewanella sp. FJAT-52076]|uniref:DUF418 domain-containing protein n=1 Tax=Shewanella sp. FJAT-52076 TaxID=2864202 RepID=UPI001C657EFF|nr:DUF418 domain-containing protein [Shewanella sp. FJAT-52076]QYJ76061.1 DUF418 domain-containing protein [Shewanella sp. FJAT-52076]